MNRKINFLLIIGLFCSFSLMSVSLISGNFAKDKTILNPIKENKQTQETEYYATLDKTPIIGIHKDSVNGDIVANLNIEYSDSGKIIKLGEITPSNPDQHDLFFVENELQDSKIDSLFNYLSSNMDIQLNPENSHKNTIVTQNRTNGSKYDQFSVTSLTTTDNVKNYILNLNTNGEVNDDTNFKISSINKNNFSIIHDRLSKSVEPKKNSDKGSSILKTSILSFDIDDAKEMLGFDKDSPVESFGKAVYNSNDEVNSIKFDPAKNSEDVSWETGHSPGPFNFIFGIDDNQSRILTANNITSMSESLNGYISKKLNISKTISFFEGELKQCSSSGQYTYFEFKENQNMDWDKTGLNEMFIKNFVLNKNRLTLNVTTGDKSDYQINKSFRYDTISKVKNGLFPAFYMVIGMTVSFLVIGSLLIIIYFYKRRKIE